MEVFNVVLKAAQTQCFLLHCCTTNTVMRTGSGFKCRRLSLDIAAQQHTTLELPCLVQQANSGDSHPDRTFTSTAGALSVVQS